jgi:dolichol-phosphate mannosyltransferase
VKQSPDSATRATGCGGNVITEFNAKRRKRGLWREEDLRGRRLLGYAWALIERQNDPSRDGSSLELAVVIPTLDEHENIEPLLERLNQALAGIAWEAIFVDDDSRDGTADLVRRLSLADRRVRIVQRVGRRGLASACLEGMMASAAPYLAVMDADLQHDETLLPRMFNMIRGSDLDLVVASRNLAPDGMGDFDVGRVRLSRLATWLSRLVLRSTHLTDPMSGFFLLRREFLSRVIRRSSGIGFKILLDLVASSPQPVRLAEMPFRFRTRLRGESKLDINVGVEYIYLVADKLIGDYVPVRFVAFVASGVPGLILHLISLGAFLRVGQPFFFANVAATALAMTLNFFINNWFTYRDARLKGWQVPRGLLVFYLACSVGALASFAIADFLYGKQVVWFVAGPAGMAVASVWNYGASQVLAWRRRRQRQAYD